MLRESKRFMKIVLSEGLCEGQQAQGMQAHSGRKVGTKWDAAKDWARSRRVEELASDSW